jgi:phosphotriesterase-related protein
MFGGESAARPGYDVARLLATVLPYLESIKNLGCKTIVDCTAAYFGRAPELLKTISEKSRLKLVTNTGYYGAVHHRYVPAHAYSETADKLAERWVHEWREGIEGTGIRPGFMKIGMDAGPLSEIDRKLVQAAARAHLPTGLTIASHTGDSPVGAEQQLSILRQEGVSPTAWIWVHAHAVKDERALLRVAEEGAWLEFDGLASATVERHLALVKMMKTRGLLGQVLLSHDGNSFRHGGRPLRPYDALFKIFLPALESAGFSQAEIRQLTVENPRRAFTVRVRAAG